MNKNKKKQEITDILVDLRRVLHDAVDMGIETNLEPYEMIVVSVNALWENRNKRKQVKQKQSIAEYGPFENNVIPLRRREVKNEG